MTTSRTFVVTDIHGAYKALKEVLDKAMFNYKTDKLICLGDVVDGWSEIKECYDLLMSIDNLVYIRGNHEDWSLQYYNNNNESSSWLSYGGYQTILSLGSINYSYTSKKPEQKYIDFMNSSVLYHIDNDRLFVHAGIPSEYCSKAFNKDINELQEYILCWDRDMVKYAFRNRKDKNFVYGDLYDEIYVGHTPTISFYENPLKAPNHYKKPLKFGNIYLCDTGANSSNCLTLMDIDTKEIYQSSIVRKLYPDERGRNIKSYNDESR